MNEELKNVQTDTLVCITILIIAFVVGLICSCTVQQRAYKITFQDGSVEYYNLEYKPKKDAKTIEFEGKTIFGVQDIELIK